MEIEREKDYTVQLTQWHRVVEYKEVENIPDIFIIQEMRKKRFKKL